MQLFPGFQVKLSFQVTTEGQYGIGLGIKREVFFLNLEDGYFGCQVNESTQLLQLYELSKLCDGVPDCYKASDELRAELKCTGESLYTSIDYLCNINLVINTI